MIESDVLKRVQSLQQFKHWSVYRLARESGLAYSSLNNLFARNTCPGIPTLEKICHGFGISLSQFFEYDVNPLRNDELTEEEDDLVNAYRSLSRVDKGLADAYLQGLCKK